jgi:hypothetical protein
MDLLLLLCSFALVRECYLVIRPPERVAAL